MGSDAQFSFFPVTDDKNRHVADKTITSLSISERKSILMMTG
ncbi:MAG TPA: hypothetical protein PLF24_00830 [Ruminococcus sp.]|nr:hypothetical protein [Ruminococcus sp.]